MPPLFVHMPAEQARVYGGEFEWVGVPYQIRVDYGVSPLQWVNGVTNMFLQSLVFHADGTFRRSSDLELMFPIGGFDLRWRYDGRGIIIDFFSDGSLLSWRWDELEFEKKVAVSAPDMKGVGHIWAFSFTYSMVQISTPTLSQLGIMDDSQKSGNAVDKVITSEGGSLKQLTAEQAKRLHDLERLLDAKRVPWVAAHALEGKQRRLLRFLRAANFDVDAAASNIQEHSLWWLEYRMDDFSPEDEFDERGPVFVCGQDRWGQPTLICRPCVHVSHSKGASIRAARRCIYTVQRCIERLRPGREKFNLIYDISGAQFWNMDWTFTHELLTVLSKNFPERMARLVCINSGWIDATLWSAICPLLDPDTKEKITFCGRDFSETLLNIVEPDHPYFKYALEVQHGGEVPCVPKASPYLPRWADVIAAEGDDPAIRSNPVLATASKISARPALALQNPKDVSTIAMYAAKAAHQLAGMMAMQCCS
jgi:hypothetical protein